jgi:hypothetical protein
MADIEIIDASALATRLCVPESWIREYSRRRCRNPIPHCRFGRYVRFRWNSPELNDWLQQQNRSSGKKR